MKKIAKIIGIILAVIIIVPLITGQVLNLFSKITPAPGQLVDVGEHKLHINCAGTETDLPPVVIEPGFSTSSSNYHWYLENLKKITKVCVYDHAGFYWSEASNVAGDSEQIVPQLHTLLNKVGLKRPFIFAGHSIAGLHTRLYVDRYPDEVAGVVFLDASHPNQFEEFGVVMNISIEEKMNEMLGKMKWLKIGMHLGLTHIYNPMDSSYLDDIFPDHIASEIRTFENEPSLITATMKGTKGILSSSNQIQKINRAGLFGDKPLIVITAGAEDETNKHHPEKDAERKVWIKLHKNHLTLSSNSKHIFIKGANHMSLITHKEYADKASEYIREMLYNIPK